MSAEPRRRVQRALRQHWLAGALLAGGVTLRVLAQFAYQPALLYIDSLKYLYGAWPGSDPLGYVAPLRAILAVGGLSLVTAVQHLLGLSVAVVLYVVLLRRGVPRWLAALAMAPMLLDAYQVQIEQTIMPDIWFEALVVAGVAIVLWRPVPAPAHVALAGLAFGMAVTVRQVAEIMVVPALVYLLVAVAGLRRKAITAGILAGAFAVPVIGYMAISAAVTGRFWLSHTGATTLYGRMAAAADCRTLRLPASERALCPTASEVASLGVDGLDHSASSPLARYHPPAGVPVPGAVTRFDLAVLAQQPLRVLGAVASDAGRLFSLSRVTVPGGTPISRWQFQTGYPRYGQRDSSGSYLRYISVGKDGHIVVGITRSGPSGVTFGYQRLSASLGGKAHVSHSLAAFLRAYQRDGGYPPGPLYLVAVLAGLAGSVVAFSRGPARGPLRQSALACLLFFGSGAALLLTSDLFEFSWRYQLPAAVTLAPAGALGATVLARRLRADRAIPAGTTTPEPAAAGGIAASGVTASQDAAAGPGTGEDAGEGTDGGKRESQAARP